jgi:DNA polymerase I
VKRCYQETRRALQKRSLPASDVATRLRLSKDGQTYLASRARQKEAQYEALLLARRKQWRVGEHVRFYRASNGTPVWGADDVDDISPLEEHEEERGAATLHTLPISSSLGISTEQPAYDGEYYQHILLTSYAERLRVALEPEDFLQIFRLDAQKSFFDRPIEHMQVRWIRCEPDALNGKDD